MEEREEVAVLLGAGERLHLQVDVLRLPGFEVGELHAVAVGTARLLRTLHQQVVGDTCGSGPSRHRDKTRHEYAGKHRSDPHDHPPGNERTASAYAVMQVGRRRAPGIQLDAGSTVGPPVVKRVVTARSLPRAG